MHTINQVVMSQLREIDIHTYILYISDEPEPEFSSSSRAEMGHFNFRTETELDFFLYSLIVRFLDPEKNVLMEIPTIRGFFIVRILKKEIFESKEHRK